MPKRTRRLIGWVRYGPSCRLSTNKRWQLERVKLPRRPPSWHVYEQPGAVLRSGALTIKEAREFCELEEATIRAKEAKG